MSKFLLGQLLNRFQFFDSLQKKFIILAFFASFLIACDYSIIRPAANSLFLSAYGSTYLPYAWLFAVPLNFLLVSCYSHFLPRFGSYKIFMATLILILFTNLFSALFIQERAWVAFFFYLWKEVYLLLVFQQLWSEIHLRFQLHEAKFFYGTMYGMGALGSTVGSLVPSFFSLESGTHNLLFSTVFVYGALLFVVRALIKKTLPSHALEERMRPHPLAGFLQVKSSSVLMGILFIVLFMQLVSTLTDFQFNVFLANSYQEIDMRTQASAKVFSCIHISSLILQFVGSYVIIQWLGVKRGHLAIPLLLLLHVLFFLLFPSMVTISLCFIAIKSLDFSLFGVLKEMLYVPLNRDEKFRAKSFIDVFAYRGAKSIASLLILICQVLAAQKLMSILSFVNVFLLLCWVIGVAFFLKEVKEVSRHA